MSLRAMLTITAVYCARLRSQLPGGPSWRDGAVCRLLLGALEGQRRRPEGQMADRSAARNFCLRLKGLSHTYLGVRSLTVLHSRARPPPILSEHDPGTAPTVSLLPSALVQAKTCLCPFNSGTEVCCAASPFSRFRGRSVVTIAIRRSS